MDPDKIITGEDLYWGPFNIIDKKNKRLFADTEKLAAGVNYMLKSDEQMQCPCSHRPLDYRAIMVNQNVTVPSVGNDLNATVGSSLPCFLWEEGISETGKIQGGCAIPAYAEYYGLVPDQEPCVSGDREEVLDDSGKSRTEPDLEGATTLFPQGHESTDVAWEDKSDTSVDLTDTFAAKDQAVLSASMNNQSLSEGETTANECIQTAPVKRKGGHPEKIKDSDIRYNLSFNEPKELLYKCLVDMVFNKENHTNGTFLWIDESKGVFRIENKGQFESALSGFNGRKKVRYENVARGLRYYYRSRLFIPQDEIEYSGNKKCRVYQFNYNNLEISKAVQRARNSQSNNAH